MRPIRRRLVLAGAFVPIVFWATLALCAAILGDYSHSSDMVSELGAEGTETRTLFAFGLMACSGLSLAFVAGLFLECRRLGLSPLPAILVLAFTFSIAGAAYFPMPHRLHGLLGSPSILLLLSPPVASILWRRSPLKLLWPVSLVSLLIMALGLLVFVPDVLNELFGLKQRFFHAGWTVWFLYLSLGFSGILDRDGIEGGDRSAGSATAADRREENRCHRHCE